MKKPGSPPGFLLRGSFAAAYFAMRSFDNAVPIELKAVLMPLAEVVEK